MATRGLSYLGLDAFYEAASNGFLTMIPFIVGPTERSENPPYMPSEGAWLQKQIVEAVVNGPNYDTTALFISYDGRKFRPLDLSWDLSKSPNADHHRNWWIWRSCYTFPFWQWYHWRVDRKSIWSLWIYLHWFRYVSSWHMWDMIHFDI